jgi:hypothetical protein
MKAPAYKKLCRKVYRTFKESLGLSYMEACAAADAVLFGEITEETLFELLKEGVE